jgi:hypothetical protein
MARAGATIRSAALPAGGPELADGLLDPERTDATLDMLGEAGQMLDPMFHNTVNATVVRGGGKVNVIPMRLPAEMKFTSLIHAADERVPAQEIGWGADRICEVLTRYR